MTRKWEADPATGAKLEVLARLDAEKIAFKAEAEIRMRQEIREKLQAYVFQQSAVANELRALGVPHREIQLRVTGEGVTNWQYYVPFLALAADTEKVSHEAEIPLEVRLDAVGDQGEQWLVKVAHETIRVLVVPGFDQFSQKPTVNVIPAPGHSNRAALIEQYADQILALIADQRDNNDEPEKFDL